MTRFYDRQGQPLRLLEWAKLFEDEAYKRVALDKVGNVTISTVWFGYDHHTHGGDGCANIFETRIRDAEVGDQFKHWDAEEQAIAGHEQLVRLLRVVNEIAS